MFGLSDKEKEQLKDAAEIAKLRALALKNGMFNSKKSAFDYYYFYEGQTVEEADRLSKLVVDARGVNEIAEIPKSTMDKVKGWVKQGSELYNEYPKVGDFIIGLLSGAATSLMGVAVGSKISEPAPQEHEIENIEPKDIT